MVEKYESFHRVVPPKTDVISTGEIQHMASVLTVQETGRLKSSSTVKVCSSAKSCLAILGVFVKHYSKQYSYVARTYTEHLSFGSYCLEMQVCAY